MGLLVFLISKAIDVYCIIIIVWVIVSWIPNLSRQYRGFVRLLDKLTYPVLRPFRRILSPYKTGGLDLSPLLAILALRVVQRLLWGLL